MLLTNPPSKTSSSTALPSASLALKPRSRFHSNNSFAPAACLLCAWSNSSPAVPPASLASNAKSPPANPPTSRFFPPPTNGPTTQSNPPANPATPPSTLAPSRAHLLPPSSPAASSTKCRRRALARPCGPTLEGLSLLQHHHNPESRRACGQVFQRVAANSMPV